MKNLSFKRLLFRGFYVNAIAVGFTAIKELVTDYSLQTDNVPNDETYQTAHDVFTAMGANLKKHPLQLIPLSKSKANAHANLMTGAYCLGYFNHAYDEFQKANHSNLSRQDFERAVYAHESVHAIEQHDLWNNYISLMTALTMMKICCSFKLRLWTICTLGSVSYFSTSRYVSRQLEFRADQLAAEKIPNNRESLISIFSVPEHHHRHLLGFFEKHPSKFERRKALEALKPSSPSVD